MLPEKMKAIGFVESKPIDAENSLVEYTVDLPSVGDKDLLVKVSCSLSESGGYKNSRSRC